MRLKECNIHNMKELYKHIGECALFNIEGWEKQGVGPASVKITRNGQHNIDLLFEYEHGPVDAKVSEWTDLEEYDFITDETFRITRLEFCPNNLNL